MRYVTVVGTTRGDVMSGLRPDSSALRETGLARGRMCSVVRAEMVTLPSRARCAMATPAIMG